MYLNKETFTSLLKDRLASTDINLVKLDVLPFINNPKELDIWSNDYFLQLAERIKLYKLQTHRLINQYILICISEQAGFFIDFENLNFIVVSSSHK